MTMPHLDIRHLRMLVALDRHKTVTSAARALGLTQPALSHQVREAERRAGVPLFRRVNRRLVLTWQGQELLQSARLIMGELERAEADLERYRGGVKALVRLGARAYCGFRWAPAFLDDITEHAPEIEVEFHTDTLSVPLSALEDGAIDLALAPGNPRRRGVEVVHLFDDDLVAVMANDHPLAKRPCVIAADLADQVYVTYSTVFEPGMEHDLLFRPARVLPATYLRAGPLDAMLALVAAGHGVTVVSRWAVAPDLERWGLATRPLTEQGLTIPWSVCHRRQGVAETPAAFVAARLAAWCGGTSERFIALTP
ncbi:MAG: LysR family transcriptional regulator [Pseudomonadota bacterium]